MSSRSLTWRRIGVGAVALATVAAGSPLLLGAAASAAPSGPATALTITRVDLPFTLNNDESKDTTAAAGTCTPYEIAATTAQGAEANAATITVTIAEDEAGSSHDVDFCLVDGGSAFRNAPQYTSADNPDEPTGGGTNEYNAGPSITSTASDSGSPPAGSELAADNEPDVASGGDPALGENQNNPSGEDLASFSTVNGKIRFGVVGLLPNQSATINAFVDNNGNLSRDQNLLTGAFADTVVAPEKRLTFTTGGASNTVAGRNAASDSVRSVVLTPKTTFAAVGGTHTYQALFFNQQMDVVGGVIFARIIATTGPNADGSFSGSCTSDFTAANEGEPTTCTYAAQEAGTDTVTVFVNQTTNNPTVGLDANEPRDTATANTTATPVAASEARFLTLQPETASVPAGSSQQFVATVTGSTGAPANGVSVTFSEDGPGVLRGGVVSGNSSSVTFTTGAAATTTSGGPSGPGRALAVLDTFAGQGGGSNTVVATITNPASTECQSTTSPAGRCTDTSPVTITAAASPSPGTSTSPSPSPSVSPTTSATPTATMSPSATTSPGQVEPGSRYRGLSSPVRVLDTRDNRGARRTGEIILDLSSRITDPNATSAVLNVTVTNGTRRGFLVAYPTGTTKPGTSNVNFETNQTQANEVVVRLGSNRRVSLFVDSASAHVIADLVGSFTSSTGAGVGEVTTNAPVRAFDSRNTATPTRRNEVVVDLTGRIPNGSTDAILNVTVTRTSARGFVTVFPTGTARPGTSNVNFEPGQTQANEVITRVGTGSNANKVSFFVDSASAALIVDVVGAVSSTTDGQTFTALASPQRALDTRNNNGGRRTGNINLVLPSSVPADATGVILNVTATNGTVPGFVTVFPGGSTNPGTSNVNFPRDVTQANEVTTGLGPNNNVTLFVGGANSPAAHVIVDVVGYLTD